MSLDNTTTIQNIFGLFEAVYVLTFMIILGGIPLTIYYYESTGVLPRLLRRKEVVPISRGADVMGITNLISYHEN